MTVTLDHYILLGTLLFLIGVVGFLIRKNIFLMFMSVELMMNGVNICFVAFARYFNHDMAGQVFVLFVMTVAAAEAAIGLAIILTLYRRRETLNADEFNLMKH
jgi:NADH-quinone oxidoreductase subunit K